MRLISLDKMKKIFKIIIPCTLILFISVVPVVSQIIEPEVERTTRDISALSDNYNRGFGINIVMNNFGFGIGGEYRHVIAPQMEFTASLRATGLRDASEQTFTDFFFGQQIIPNKYQRAFAFPLILGLRQRIFASAIQDDFRFFLSAGMGPAASFAYPYFDDPDNYGYRFTGNELVLINDELFRLQSTRVNDIFGGLNQGEWKLGAAGEFKLSLDIGSNFSRLSTIDFGYYFYYFPDGIQLMMPNQPVFRTDVPRPDILKLDEQGNFEFEPFFESQRFFGSPQITFTFGWQR